MKTTQSIKRKYIFMGRIIFATLIGILVLQISSCKSDKKGDKVQLTVRMTDSPANYEAVTIDVQGVEIVGDKGSTVALNTTSGLYNLLDLTNGINTILATGYIEAGKVSQIRLILGPANTVRVNKVNYPLSTPSAMQSGLKIQMNQTYEAGIDYNILLDFDANQSIIQKGNNEYQLKPVIRTIDEAISGTIKGSILPIGGNVTITATSNGITYTSAVNSNGYFLITGLPSGTYDITVTPDLPLIPITLTGKTVMVGTSTDLGIITLH
jgi:hypothetical protein